MKKTTAILFSAALLLCNCFTSKAQDVDGISLWDKITKEQLIERYGEPVEYNSQENNEDELGLIEEIVFKDVSIRLEGNIVVEFGIFSTKPRAMTKLVNVGLMIGDSEEMVKHLENYFHNKRDQDGYTIYKYVFDYDSTFNIVTKDGKIIDMYACALTT